MSCPSIRPSVSGTLCDKTICRREFVVVSYESLWDLVVHLDIAQKKFLVKIGQIGQNWSKIDIFDQNALFFQFFLHFRHSKLILNKRKSCWSNLVTSGQIAKTGQIGQIWSKMILGQMVDFRAFFLQCKSDQKGPFILQKKIFGPNGPVVRPLRSWPKHWTWLYFRIGWF